MLQKYSWISKPGNWHWYNMCIYFNAILSPTTTIKIQNHSIATKTSLVHETPLFEFAFTWTKVLLRFPTEKKFAYHSLNKKAFLLYLNFCLSSPFFSFFYFLSVTILSRSGFMLREAIKNVYTARFWGTCVSGPVFFSNFLPWVFIASYLKWGVRADNLSGPTLF